MFALRPMGLRGWRLMGGSPSDFWVLFIGPWFGSGALDAYAGWGGLPGGSFEGPPLLRRQLPRCLLARLLRPTYKPSPAVDGSLIGVDDTDNGFAGCCANNDVDIGGATAPARFIS